MLLALAATASPDQDQGLSQMTVLYEQVCLKAFPDDKAVEALMGKQNAKELTPDEVRVQGAFAAPIGASALGQGNAFTLAFPQQ
jgi:hypothetical protein